MKPAPPTNLRCVSSSSVSTEVVPFVRLTLKILLLYPFANLKPSFKILFSFWSYKIKKILLCYVNYNLIDRRVNVLGSINNIVTALDFFHRAPHALVNFPACIGSIPSFGSTFFKTLIHYFWRSLEINNDNSSAATVGNVIESAAVTF